MSFSGLSFDSFSPPYNVPQQFISEFVEEIQVYDIKADNIGLMFLNARHCYCILKLQNGRKVKLQGGKNDDGLLQITYSNQYLSNDRSRRLLKVVLNNERKRFYQMGEYLKQSYMGSVYHILKNNCYDVCIKLLRFFKKYSEVQIVKKYKRKQLRNAQSTITVTAIQGAIGGALFGPIGFVIGAIAGKTYGWITENSLPKNDVLQ